MLYHSFKTLLFQLIFPQKLIIEQFSLEKTIQISGIGQKKNIYVRI